MNRLRVIKVLMWLVFLVSAQNLVARDLLIDSATVERIVKAGQNKLQALISQNENYLKRGETEKLNFVINLSPEDYITDLPLSGNPTFLSSATIEGGYNARLNQVYLSQGIECYYILINYFDVKMKAEMPATSSLKDLFAEGSFFDQNSNIQDLKFLHEAITRNILTTPIASNRKRYVLSLANYCCAEFNNSTGGSGCFRLYSLNTVEPVNSPPIAYYNELFEYYRQYLNKDQSFLSESGRDALVDKMITDFEKSASNYKKKALILQTNTVNDLKTILSFFSNEDYQLLSNKERTHIFKVFSGGSIGHTTEIEILSLLNTVSRDSTNTILTDLITVNVNGKRLLKHFFDGFQAGNYKDMVQRLTQLIGNSTLYQHNLPDVETALIQNKISPSWSKVYEWSDCSTSTMYLEEQNTDECKRPSYWKHAEKRYHTITMSNTGMVEINGKYKNVTNTINANGSFVVNYENITPASLHPYDLVFLVDKSTIEGLNDVTESSGGTMVVPACFLVYAKDKAFSRDLFEATMALTSIVGPEEILASKLLSKLSGFKRLLKFVRKAEIVGNNTGDVVRGVSKADFFSSVVEFQNGANFSIGEQAFDLWKNEKWAELEQLFISNNLNKYNGIVFPPNNGAIDVVRKNLDPLDYDNDLIIDRYGATTGKFAAPANTPFGQRALPISYQNQIPQKYKVLKTIPNVEEGKIIPWFNQPGMGVQYKFEQSVQYYIDEGYLVAIP